MSLSQFREISKVHNPENESDPNKIAQRDLDINHCKGLAKHILVGLIETQIRRYKTDGEIIPKEVLDIQQDVGKSPYAVIQPFVCNIRECSRDGDDLDILDYSSKYASKDNFIEILCNDLDNHIMTHLMYDQFCPLSDCFYWMKPIFDLFSKIKLLLG